MYVFALVHFKYRRGNKKMTLVLFNTVSACFMLFMCANTLFSPREFMAGGISKIPWFKNIPDDPRHRVYFTSVFLSLVCIGGGVVPTILAPNSSLVCLQNIVLYFANLVHVGAFLGSDAYKDIRPDKNTKSYAQWIFMACLTLGLGCWGISTYHSEESTWLSGVTFDGPITVRTANIVGIVFSSIFGIQFTLIPQRLLSAFWSDTATVEGKSFLGFPIVKAYAGEIFWARNSGLTILGLNACGLALGLSNPLLTIQLLLVTSMLTLFNINQLIMAPYGEKNPRNVYMSWIPTLLLCSADIAVSALALLT